MTTFDPYAQLRRETPGAAGFDPADEDVGLTFAQHCRPRQGDRQMSVALYDDSDPEPFWTGPYDAFEDSNSGGFDDEEWTAIRTVLRDKGEVCIGGGAAPLTRIVRTN